MKIIINGLLLLMRLISTIIFTISIIGAVVFIEDDWFNIGKKLLNNIS